MLYLVTYSLMENLQQIESEKQRRVPEPYCRAKLRLTRTQLFRLLQEENLGEFER